MANGDVHLLDVGGVIRGDDNGNIHQGRQLTAVTAEEADGREALSPCLGDSRDDVGGPPGCRDTYEDIAELPVGLHLSRKDLVVAHVVADGGDGRGVGAQGQRGERAAVWVFVAAGQLRGDMLRIRGGPAVAAKEDPAPSREGLDEQRGGIGYRWSQVVKDCLGGADMPVQVVGKQGGC